MDDLISRQAAIAIERNATVDTNPSHFEAHQKFTQFMDDAEVSSFGRWQWSNGFNTALTAVGIDLKNLPSAQPYTDEEIQKMQDIEQAQLDKAYEMGKADALRWIPCSERLPKHGGRYLISVLDGTNRRTTVAPYLPRCKAWTMTGRMAYWKVIAWMPLPEPAKLGDD